MVNLKTVRAYDRRFQEWIIHLTESEIAAYRALGFFLKVSLELFYSILIATVFVVVFITPLNVLGITPPVWQFVGAWIGLGTAAYVADIHCELSKRTAETEPDQEAEPPRGIQ